MPKRSRTCARCDRPISYRQRKYCSNQCRESAAANRGTGDCPQRFMNGEDPLLDPEDVLYGDYADERAEQPGLGARTSVHRLRSRVWDPGEGGWYR